MFTHNIDPILFSSGIITIRWYGILLALGIGLAILITRYFFKKEKLQPEIVYELAFYMTIGLIIGARLGYILFYNLDYYINNPAAIIKIWEGGLSSHGATMGLLVAYTIFYLVQKKQDKNLKFYKYADLIVISFPIVAACVRIGNYINNEILGRVMSDGANRHPVTLYEALSNIIIFIILFLTYKYYKNKKPYFMVFFFVFIYFTSRFGLEFFKEYQIFSNGLTMGQWLSILPIIISLIYFIYIFFKKNRDNS
ncbi:MAG: prolipoprotein diacylglyceryl transferase [Patescibacteria group bacterium]